MNGFFLSLGNYRESTRKVPRKYLKVPRYSPVSPMKEKDQFKEMVGNVLEKCLLKKGKTFSNLLVALRP